LADFRNTSEARHGSMHEASLDRMKGIEKTARGSGNTNMRDPGRAPA
jgi:hypothetical protein